jgi:hypothetical protein
LKYLQNCNGRKLKGREHVGDRNIDGAIILKLCLGEIVSELMGWNQPAQDSGQWCAFVNMVMNLGFHNKREFHDHKCNCQLVSKTLHHGL